MGPRYGESACKCRFPNVISNSNNGSERPALIVEGSEEEEEAMSSH